MPKSTQRGDLVRAARSGKLMLQTVVEAYDSGDVNRIDAALFLAQEFHNDMRKVIVPLLEAVKESKANANGENREVTA